MPASPAPNWRGEHAKPWYYRWRHHVLIGSWLDMVAIHRDGSQALDPRSMVMNFGVLPTGIICGGFAVGAVRWIIDNMFYYLPDWCIYLVGAIVLFGGPDLLLPLTLLNGCEGIGNRMIWLCFLACWHRFVNETNSFQCMMLLSGLWHIDRGDYEYKKFQWICAANQSIALSEDNISNTITHFKLLFFRAAAGIGMLWAGFGVYSLGVFLKALLGYIGIQLFIFVCIGGSASFQALAEIQGRR